MFLSLDNPHAVMRRTPPPFATPNGAITRFSAARVRQTARKFEAALPQEEEGAWCRRDKRTMSARAARVSAAVSADIR